MICMQHPVRIAQKLQHFSTFPKAATLLNWDNVVSVGLDNTYCNMGNKNSLKTRILEKNSSCFVAGCNCHLVHSAAGKGEQAYSDISGFDCEDHQVDLYYFFKGSSRRKGIFTEYLDFVGLEW